MHNQCKNCRKFKYQKLRCRDPARSLFQNSAANAVRRNVEHSLTYEWVRERVERGVCELSGVPFVFGGNKHPRNPSIDRIDSSRGYTPDNCRIALWMLNAGKNDAEDQVFVDALRLVAESMANKPCDNY